MLCDCQEFSKAYIDGVVIFSKNWKEHSEHLWQAVVDLERGARLKIFGLPCSLLVTLEVRTEYLEATLVLVKCLEISKELIRVCNCTWLQHATAA